MQKLFESWREYLLEKEEKPCYPDVFKLTFDTILFVVEKSVMGDDPPEDFIAEVKSGWRSKARNKYIESPIHGDDRWPAVKFAFFRYTGGLGRGSWRLDGRPWGDNTKLLEKKPESVGSRTHPGLGYMKNLRRPDMGIIKVRGTTRISDPPWKVGPVVTGRLREVRLVEQPGDWRSILNNVAVNEMISDLVRPHVLVADFCIKEPKCCSWLAVNKE